MKNSGFFNSGDRTSLNANNNVNSASRNSLRKTTDSERK